MVEDREVADCWRLARGLVLGPGTWARRDLFVQSGLIAAPNEVGNSVTIDCSGLRLIPGYIDLQINGGWGVDLQTSPELVWELAAALPSVGVTSFLPTLTTNGFERLAQARRTLADGPAPGWRGATPVGWHLEGPWISPRRKGAHDGARIEPLPSAGCVPAGVSLAGGVRMITLAPELAGAGDVIAELVEKGVVVSVGHSEATAEQTRSAMAAGASMGTHLFNAMSGLDHRNPGMAAALLDGNAKSWIGLIADGHHVSVESLSLAWRLASDRVVLVSDAVAGLGKVDREVARLADGTIAGSLTSLDRCVRLMVERDLAAPAAAVAAATAHPAEALRLEDRGRLEPGLRGDVVALDDDLSVVFTMVGGELVHDRR